MEEEEEEEEERHWHQHHDLQGGVRGVTFSVTVPSFR